MGGGRSNNRYFNFNITRLLLYLNGSVFIDDRMRKWRRKDEYKGTIAGRRRKRDKGVDGRAEKWTWCLERLVSGRSVRQ